MNMHVRQSSDPCIEIVGAARSGLEGRGNSRCGRQAFSLIEVLLVVTIMSVIVVGLYTMFDQTQRALRGNTAQVDVLEAGRAALDLISRDIEQCVASHFYEGTNLMARITYPNLKYWTPLRQELMTNQNPALNVYRTNFLQDLFFLTRYKDNWGGVGFFVAGSATNALYEVSNGIGTLYRYAFFPEPPVFRLNTNLLLALVGRFEVRASNNVSPVMQGVVHFGLKAYDPFGIPLDHYRVSTYEGYKIYRLAKNQTPPVPLGPINVLLQPESYLPLETRFIFLTNALPAYLELELGVLEPQALERIKAFPRPDLQRQYLERHAGFVHLFRKHIPIRPATQ
jgi:prepilin-type N-terminal cleavage/methylation domain-containing protein